MVVEFEHRNVSAQLAPESAHTIVCGTRNHTHARPQNVTPKIHSTGTASQSSGSSPAGMSHTAYIDAAHWSSTSYALQGMCIKITWMGESTFTVLLIC